MPTTAEIKTLKNLDGTLIVYPESIASAIYSPALGTNIEDGFFSSLGSGFFNNLVTLDGTQTITGNKTFSRNMPSSGGSQSPILTLENTGEVTGYTGGNGIWHLVPNLQSGGTTSAFLSGKNRTSGNSCAIHFHYEDDDSANNFMAMSIYGHDNLLRAYADNRVSIGEPPHSTNHQLTVAGPSIFKNYMQLYRETSINNNLAANLEFQVLQTDNNILSTGAYIRAFDDHDEYNYGLNLVIGGSSNVVLGSGESADNFYRTVLAAGASSAENLYFTTDDRIDFYVNCQTIANRSRAAYIDNNAINVYKEMRSWNYNHVLYMHSNVVRGTVPESNYYNKLSFKDQSGHNLAYLEYGMTTTNSRLNLWVLGHHLSSEQYGGIYITKNQGNTGNYTASYNANTGEFTATKVWGAVWNDYAEYRETKENIQPGRCIKETGKGDLILTTKRLEEGCEIVSDTFGFAIGKSEKCQTPTAAVGRVLAYLYEERAAARPGQPVCSGPNGTVSLMTNEEAREYPWCIIGTISEIPDYDEWLCGGGPEGSDSPEPINVDGRVWIRVR